MASARRGKEQPRGAGTPHPPWLILLAVVPVAAWLLASRLPSVDVESAVVRRLCRDLGYIALAALIVPYLYAWRRRRLHQPRGHMTRWMRLHIGAAYLAFGLMIVHARGRLIRVELTTGIVALFGIVLLSGVLGFLLQKLIYRFMALTLDRELGPGRLEAERVRLIEEAGALVENYSRLVERDITDWPKFCAMLLDEETKLHEKVWQSKWFPHTPKQLVKDAVEAKGVPDDRKDIVVAAVNELLGRADFCRKLDFGTVPKEDEAYPLLQLSPQALSGPQLGRRNRLLLERICPDVIARSVRPPRSVTRFFEEEVDRYLRSEFPSWGWLLRASALEPVPRNHYLRVRALSAPEQAGMIDQLWEWVERRRRMDLEFWFHRLARAWLLVHGPLAWPLLGLVLFHVLTSIYYGGWL